MPSQRGDWLGVLSGRVWGRGPERSLFVTMKTKIYSSLFRCSGCWSFTQLGGCLFQQPEDRPPLAFTGFRIK